MGADPPEPAAPYLGTADIPPDMVLLLQGLEQDFTVNKTIDQWTYINRREEIMKSVNRLHQQQHNQVKLNPGQLEKVLKPRQNTTPAANLVSVLRDRATLQKNETVFMVLDLKGKEQQSITWDKLFAKAVKVAVELRHRTKPGDTVVLLYKENEVCEFVVALFGCFLANVAAVCMHQDISIVEMYNVVRLAQLTLVLMSEGVSKELERLAAGNSKLQWPSKVSRLKSTALGSARKSDMESVFKLRSDLSDLAYVEFSRLPVGEFRGISLNHSTVLNQLACLDSSLSSLPGVDSVRYSPKNPARRRLVFLATIDLRIGIGLIVGVLFSVYLGNVLVWAPPRVMEVQGLYAHLISKIKANLLLADFLGLKRVTYDYQLLPNATRYYSKTQRVDFSSIKWMLVNSLTVDGEFIEVLLERYLKPLGCMHPRNAIIPMLTLSEYGGMVISMRDWLGGAENMGILDYAPPDELLSVLIDKEALSRNKVVILDTNPQEVDEHLSDMLRVDSFGFPLLNATLAVVNPELSTIVLKGELGEIWIDSPCLAGGFFGLTSESKLIFHAKCKDANGTLELNFLRTGLLGFTYLGKVYVLGLYEDRIRQRVSWMDQKLYRRLKRDLVVGSGIKYHYSSHLLATLASEVRQLYDCTIFDVFIGNEYLPVAIVEAEVIRRVIDEPENGSNGTKKDKYDYLSAPMNEPVLNALAQKCFDTLNRHHVLRLFCVVVVDLDCLPKVLRSGGPEIASMLCKKRFLEGTLQAEFVKFFVRQLVSMIPHGEDVLGGIWLPYASQIRSSSLLLFPPQLSTVDYRATSIDDKTGAPITDFKTIIDVLKLRVATTGDSVAFQNIDTSGKSSSKPLTWKKFLQRVLAVCHYLIEKMEVRARQYIILMYSLLEEFIVALFACIMCGIIAVPMLPFDSNRIGEDFPAFVGVVKDFDIREVLVNDDVEKFMKNGPVADALKKMNNRSIKPIRLKNTTKVTKVPNTATLNSKIARYQSEAQFRNEDTVCLIWLNFTSDHYRVASELSHKNVMKVCKVIKETCNLSSKSAVVGCVRHSAGIGFVQAALLGVFLGTTTYLSSPVNFAENPLAFFAALSRYKVKDVFVTEQMLKYAVSKATPKSFVLSLLKNMMISTESRVEVDLLRKIARVFQPTKLSASSMSAVYTHHFNPIITTRLYMLVAPVDLYLDPIALRQGFVSVVNQAEYPNALRIQDSGMVPVCSEIAIVNPETGVVCREGEFGEIWVNSEANLTSFTNGPKGPPDHFSKQQFNGKLAGDPLKTYLRTGDLGFLHNISVSKNTGGDGQISTFRPLFVLGKISDTFEVMGLHHFAMDIESTIELCHPDMYKNGLCIFKCSDFTIVVCESKWVRNLAALVPLIVNTVFSKHHLIVDIVAFIKKGEFPISRLGTKQRARIVDAWVQGILPVKVTFGVNYGENSMIKLIKEIDLVARNDPVTGLRNPAALYYDNAPDFSDALHLNREERATFDMVSHSSGASNDL